MILRKKNNLLKILVLVLCIFGGISSLLYFMQGFFVFFYTPTEVLAMNNNLPSHFRICGIVESYITETLPGIKFYLADDAERKMKIAVEFNGDVPFMFREQQSVIVEGQMINNIFQASRVLVKHDETYYPKNNPDT